MHSTTLNTSNTKSSFPDLHLCLATLPFLRNGLTSSCRLGLILLIDVAFYIEAYLAQIHFFYD